MKRVLLTASLIALSYNQISIADDTWSIDPDFEINKSSETTSKNIIGKLFDNSTTSLSNNYIHFFKDKTGLMSEQFYSQLGFDTKARMNNLSLGLDIYGQYTSEDNVLKGIFSDFNNSSQYYKYVDIAELYLGFTINKMELTIGKVITTNKVSEIFSITDKYNEASYVLYENAKKIGRWQARLEYFLSDTDSLTFALMPFEQKRNIFSSKSRWYPNNDSSTQSLPINSDAVVVHTYNKGAKQLSYLAKYAASRQDLDYFINLHYGIGRYNTVRAINDVVIVTTVPVKKPIVFDPSFGIVKVNDDYRIYSEIYYQQSIDQDDDDFIQSLFGLEFTASALAEKLKMEEIKTTFEVTMEYITNDKDNPALPSSRRSHVNNNAFIGKLEFKITNKLDAYLLGFFDHKYKGSLIIPAVSYRYNDYVSFSLKQSMYQSHGDDITIEDWKDNDNIMVTVLLEY